MKKNLKLKYEYDFISVYDDGSEHAGHFETENKKEIIKRFLTTFTDLVNKRAKARTTNERIIDGERVTDIIITYSQGETNFKKFVAKFSNVPIMWGYGEIDVARIDL